MVFGGRASCWFHANARDFGILAEQMVDAVVSTDLAFISILATVGIMTAIPPDLVLEALVGAAAFAVIMDQVKVALFISLRIA